MTLTRAQRDRRHALTAEAVREVGVLLVAFAPLDLAFSEFKLRAVVLGLFFLLLGLSSFTIGLRYGERP